MRNIHYTSGIILALFIGPHLINHVLSLAGPRVHIDYMNALRLVYRNTFVEAALLLAVVVQIVSGVQLYFQKKADAASFFEKIHLWSGLYMAAFFVFHVSAVMAGRHLLHLDTNIYFGAAGLNIFPVNLFFVPYYGLAIMSFWGHIAAVHAQKAKRMALGLSPIAQGKVILGIGALCLALTFWGMTNGFQGLDIPAAYTKMYGK